MAACIATETKRFTNHLALHQTVHLFFVMLLHYRDFTCRSIGKSDNLAPAPWAKVLFFPPPQAQKRGVRDVYLTFEIATQ
eukprot:1095240-Amphidinium_carterae.1